MKEKVLMLIIGILIGAIITAGGFLIYLKTNETNNQTIPNGPMDMRNFTPGERPEMDFENGDFPEPPELPDEENGDEFVDMKYVLENKPETNQPIQRLRRITGYIVPNLERWNDGKRAELADRVKHGICPGDDVNE